MIFRGLHYEAEFRLLQVFCTAKVVHFSPRYITMVTDVADDGHYISDQQV